LRRPETLVQGLGLPEPLASRLPPSAWHLLLLHPGGPGQPPWWTWAPLVLAGVVATAYSRRGAATRLGMASFLIGVGAAVAVSRAAGVAAAPGSRHWTGGLLLVAATGLLVAVVTAAEETPRALRTAAFGWRQPAAAVIGVALVAASVVVGAHWLARSDVGAPGTVRAGGPGVLPVFALASAQAPTVPRVLALTADHDAVHYTVLRGAAGLQLGDTEVGPFGSDASAASRSLQAAVRDAAAGRPVAAGELAGFGVTLVVVPDVSGALGRLASVPGLSRVPATDTVVYRAALPAGELAVLAGADATLAAGGAPLPAQARPALLPAGAGRADTTVPAGPADRLLVLAEPVSSHWRATLDGRPLTPALAYVWAQAWRLPAASGRLVVRRSGDSRSAGLLVELAVVAVLLLLCLPARRFGRASSDADRAGGTA
jgi:hypothetical protein